MNGIIILDGPDATGKTTLQEFFVKKYDAIPIHLTWNKELALRMFDYQTEEMLRAVELSTNHLVVVDRHWISEKIYANVLRGGSPWPLMGRMMDRVWRKHAALYIITLPVQSQLGFEMALQRHNDNIDNAHPYTDQQFMKLLHQYSDFYNDNITRHDMIPYFMEFDGHNLDKFTERVMVRLNFLQTTQYPPALLPRNTNIAGHSAKARYLIIGEQVNCKDNPFSWPFYAYKNSSLFLTEVIAELKINETWLMWANAKNADGSFNILIPELIIRYGLVPIVLGNEAERVLRNNGFKNTTTIMHPSYARRFNKHDAFKKDLCKAVQAKDK